jgi:hypothetical protein
MVKTIEEAMDELRRDEDAVRWLRIDESKMQGANEAGIASVKPIPGAGEIER